MSAVESNNNYCNALWGCAAFSGVVTYLSVTATTAYFAAKPICDAFGGGWVDENCPNAGPGSTLAYFGISFGTGVAAGLITCVAIPVIAHGAVSIAKRLCPRITKSEYTQV